MEEASKKTTKTQKGLFSGLGGVGGWFSALMGKKTTSSQTVVDQENLSPQQEEQKQVEKKEEKPAERITMAGVMTEDSIKEDVKSFKQFVKKTADTVGPKVGPFAKQGSRGVSSVFAFLETTAGKVFLRRIIRSFLIVFFVLVLVFVGVRLFDSLDPNGTTPQISTAPITPVEYVPPKDSVYANDPEILNMEEELNVLERELSRTSLREDRLFPPDLDFNISF